MLLNMDITLVKAFLENNEDCEMLSEGEYVADLFDCDAPMTVNLKIEKDEIRVLAAAYLLYDEAQDGWYMGDRIEDETILVNAFEAAMRENK